MTDSQGKRTYNTVLTFDEVVPEYLKTGFKWT